MGRGGGGLYEAEPGLLRERRRLPESARPFCDVAGEFEESGNTPHLCSARPEGCSVERCGCTPGTVTCSGDQETVCADDGRSVMTRTCGLGCAADGTRCLTFEPSNDLGDALDEAAGEPDVVVPAGATIDTTTGVIASPGGATVTVRSMIVAQGAQMVRVFLARSFVLNDVSIRGDHAFAAVAPGTIIVKGRIDASADGRTGGPGAQEGAAACVGAFAVLTECGSGNCAPGAGGGGNATAGGRGGGLEPRPHTPGGSAQSSFAPLLGGCRGGDHRNTGGSVLNQGGAGGGAVQLVSLDSVTLEEFGFIDVGGGGGDTIAGGGSGGNILIEAPIVRLTGSTVGLTANGGAGGGCQAPGPDATPTLTPALGPSSCSYSAGHGGTVTQSSLDAYYCEYTGGTSCFAVTEPGGGGGGAVGRARIVTRTGELEQDGAPILSVSLSRTALTAQ